MARPSKKILEEGFYRYKKRASEGKCWVHSCQREAKKDRCMCHMHHQRRWRVLHKGESAYCTLRDHARSRRIPFTISYDYFAGICDAFGFWKEPPEGEVLTIDRVRPHEGYVEGNLQIVSHSINVIKGNRERRLPEHVQDILRRRREEAQEEYRHFLDNALEGDGDELDDELPF